MHIKPAAIDAPMIELVRFRLLWNSPRYTKMVADEAEMLRASEREKV